MRKILSIMLISGLMLIAFILCPAKVHAATLNEHEDNDTLSKANLITPGDTMNGNTNADYDCDFYKMISNEDGKINLNFNNNTPTTVGKKGWYVTLFGPNNEEIGMVTVDMTQTETVVLPFIGAKAGTYYYLIVSPAYGSTQGCKYTIRTSFTKGKYYEKEPNNTESTSGKLVLTKDHVGNIGADYTNGDSSDTYDNDYYYIKAPAKGTMTINFKHKNIKRKVQYDGWDVEFYKHQNGGNATLTRYQLLSDDDKTLNKQICPKYTVSKGSYFWIRVKSIYDISNLGGGYNYTLTNVAGQPYTISSTFVLAAKPKLKAKSTKNSITLTSNKLSDITGYEVEMKVGKKYKKVKTYNKKALKYTKKGLKKKTKYTFRVRAYLKADGIKYYGKWVTISVKTK